MGWSGTSRPVDLFYAMQKMVRRYLPKGHLHTDETPEQAAEREIREELGLDQSPECLGKLTISRHSFFKAGDDRPQSKLVHLFVYRFASRVELHCEARPNVVEAAWVPYDTALQQLARESEYLAAARELFLQVQAAR